MHPDNTVICQVRVSRAAMKASQEEDGLEEGDDTAEAPAEQAAE